MARVGRTSIRSLEQVEHGLGDLLARLDVDSPVFSLMTSSAVIAAISSSAEDAHLLQALLLRRASRRGVILVPTIGHRLAGLAFTRLW